jgi:TolB-like protein
MMEQLNVAAIERELEILLQSQTFAKAEQLRLLLDYLVRHALAGHMDALTEVAIGQNALKRPRGFAPLEDSGVRKAMGRLRSKLKEYYAGEGRRAQVHFVFDKYMPKFVHKAAPCLFLLPLSPVNFHDADYFAAGLTEDLMIALAGEGKIQLVPRTTANHLRNQTGDLREYYRETGADVMLDGSVRRVSDGEFQITLSWVDGPTAVFESYLQARTRPNDTLAAVHDLAAQITRRLDSPSQSNGGIDPS